MNNVWQLKICSFGVIALKIFLITVTILTVGGIISAFLMIPDRWLTWLLWILCLSLAEFVLFWIGIISVYCTSVQLGIKIRVLGAVLGMIPILNLIFLIKIIRTTSMEVEFEKKKIQVNAARKEEKICETKYPVLLVHGVFFRDYKFPNYWGRIPKELELNGAEVYFGNQQSAASVEDSGKELVSRIKEIVKACGCQKVNVIGHSKGGLDIRCAVNQSDIGRYIASITTINTPHRGCEFAQYLLEKIPVKMQEKIAGTYNSAMRKLGDKNPDFMAAVNDLTADTCKKMDSGFGIPEGIFCQSVGSKLNKATNGKFPLNFTYNLVKYFDGPNDGLVSETSFEWGEKYTFITTDGKRGVSHGDMIDLNRENIDGFDVREFYVSLVADLKNRGL